MNKKTDDAILRAWSLGVAMSVVVVLGLWHLGESVCQTRNNVSDCVLPSMPFVPANRDE